jgi:hypothetical protein
MHISIYVSTCCQRDNLNQVRNELLLILLENLKKNHTLIEITSTNLINVKDLMI